MALFALPLVAPQHGVQAEEPRAAAPAREQQEKLLVVGYLPDYRVKVVPDDVGKHLTDLVLFSLEPKPSGDLDTSRLTADKVARAVALKKRHKLSLHVSVGGWGRSKGFAAMTQDARRRSRFVERLLAYCRKNQFDGVDYDWEFPGGPKQREAYVDLLVETKAALAPHKMLVSVALAPLQPLPAKGLHAVDRVHLMSYNHDGRHSTFEQAKSDVAKFLAKGLAPKKLFLGIPFYGRTVTKPARHQIYSQIVRRHQPGYDVNEHEGYYFNGVNLVRRKTEFAIDQQLGGVMIWEVSLDATGRTSLLSAISRVRQTQDD